MDEVQRLAHYEQIRRTLDRAVAFDAGLEQRAIARQDADRDERHVERERMAAQQQQQQQRRPAPAPPARLDDATLIDVLGQVIGRERTAVRQRFEGLEARLAASEQATCALFSELEDALKELKARAVLKPAELRVVGFDGGSDAA